MFRFGGSPRRTGKDNQEDYQELEKMAEMENRPEEEAPAEGAPAARTVSVKKSVVA